MINDLTLILIVFISIAGMIYLITRMKVHPFFALLLTAFFIGLATKLPLIKIVSIIKLGFGGILGDIGIIILAGSIIGTILEKSGATITMSNTILSIVGEKKAPLTMSVVGSVTSIPVICDSGFIIFSPINRALASRLNISLTVMATALSSGLFVTFCMVPPAPGPIIIANTLKANIGLVIMVAIVVAIPVILVGYIYSIKVASKIYIDPNSKTDIDEMLKEYESLPNSFVSFMPLALPVLLITLKSISNFPTYPMGRDIIYKYINFIGDPACALIIGLIISLYLIPSKKNQMEWFSEGIRNAAPILAISGAGGALSSILSLLPIDKIIGSSIVNHNLGILLPFIIAMLLKTSMGASTPVMIITSAMIFPLLSQMGMTSEIAKVLVVLAIGAGSMTVSHANDSFFWVVSQYSDMDAKTAYKCHTGVTLVQGITAIIIISILSMILI